MGTQGTTNFVFRVGLVLIGSVTACCVASDVQFNRDIRPILSEHCYACHGPGEQEADLRLDSFARATAELPSGLQAIVPGQADGSELLSRIDAADPDIVMPPPHTNKPLSADDREILRRWIDPENPPGSIMLQFKFGGWNHRAVWGDPNLISWG